MCPPASSTPPLPRAGSRKEDLWGLAFTLLDDSLTHFGPRPVAESGRLMCCGPWSQDPLLGSAFLLSPGLLGLLWPEGWPHNQTGTDGELKLCVALIQQTHIWRHLFQLGWWVLRERSYSGSAGTHKELLPSQLVRLS